MSGRHAVALLLAPAALLLAACGGGGGGGGGPTAPGPVAQSVTVELHDHSFAPRSLTIQPGDTVVWVLRGNDRTHTVTALNGAFDSGQVFGQPGATFRRTFNEAGRTFDYRCRSHADCCNMRGSVRVGDSAPPPTPGYE
jgi:plastocyanin